MGSGAGAARFARSAVPGARPAGASGSGGGGSGGAEKIPLQTDFLSGPNFSVHEPGGATIARGVPCPGWNFMAHHAGGGRHPNFQALQKTAPTASKSGPENSAKPLPKVPPTASQPSASTRFASPEMPPPVSEAVRS